MQCAPPLLTQNSRQFRLSLPITIAISHRHPRSRIPAIGSVYTYAYNSSGELVAFLVAWQGVLEPLSASINALGAVGYFKSFLVACGLSVDGWFHLNLAAPVLLLMLTLLALFDVSLSRNFMNLFTVWNLSLLLLFVLCGALLVDFDLWLRPCDHI